MSAVGGTVAPMAADVARALIDAKLFELHDRTLVNADEVTDLLLDLRSLLPAEEPAEAPL